jgi:Cu/Ag efflux protein CusF
MGIGSIEGEPNAPLRFNSDVPSRETAMKHTKLVLAAAAILTVSATAAFAEDELKGQVTQVNRLNNTVAIRPIQEGTVGANTAGSDQQFKVKDGVSLEDLHAGNRITYSVTDNGGTRTVTKFKVQ